MTDDDRPSEEQRTEPPASGGGGEEEGPVERISLDRYLSQRRPPVRSPMMQIISLVLMLAALIMVFIYKDRCGLAAADFFGGAPPASQPASQPGLEPRRAE